MMFSNDGSSSSVNMDLVKVEQSETQSPHNLPTNNDMCSHPDSLHHDPSINHLPPEVSVPIPPFSHSKPAASSSIRYHSTGMDGRVKKPKSNSHLRKNILWVSHAHKEIATEVIKDALLLEFHSNIVDFERLAHRLKERVPNEDDWSALLRQNKRLLINLIFGLYLTATEAEAQLLWLKALNSTCTCHLKIFVFKDASFFIRDTLSLFNGDIAMQNAYLGFSESLKAKFPMTPSSKKLLFQLLFFYPGKLCLNDATTVWQECVSAMAQLPMFGEKDYHWLLQNISEMGETLDAMAVLFEHSGLASHRLSRRPIEPQTNSATMGYTVEEELWLVANRDQSLYAMESIQMGPEFSAEALNFSLHGTPLTPNFGVMATYGFQERLWQLYGQHSEFQELSRENQVKLVRSGIHIFWALMAARMHGVPMVEQVKFNHSETEINSDPALEQIAAKSVRAIKVEDVFPSIPIKMVHDCISKLQPLLRREDDSMTFFALLVLAVYGNGIPSSDPVWSGMRSVGKKYELVVARKFSARKEVAKLHNAVSNLQIIASALPIPI